MSDSRHHTRHHDEKWYWDLDKKRAVPASERGVADNTLGPYDTRAEAENWQSRVEQRNEAWDEADEEWAESPSSDPSTDPST